MKSIVTKRPNSSHISRNAVQTVCNNIIMTILYANPRIAAARRIIIYKICTRNCKKRVGKLIYPKTGRKKKIDRFEPNRDPDCAARGVVYADGGAPGWFVFHSFISDDATCLYNVHAHNIIIVSRQRLRSVQFAPNR